VIGACAERANSGHHLEHRRITPFHEPNATSTPASLASVRANAHSEEGDDQLLVDTLHNAEVSGRYRNHLSLYDVGGRPTPRFIPNG